MDENEAEDEMTAHRLKNKSGQNKFKGRVWDEQLRYTLWGIGDCSLVGSEKGLRLFLEFVTVLYSTVYLPIIRTVSQSITNYRQTKANAPSQESLRRYYTIITSSLLSSIQVSPWTPPIPFQARQQDPELAHPLQSSPFPFPKTTILRLELHLQHQVVPPQRQ